MHVCACSCRPVYVSAVRPQSKHIVVMVDHGASVTDTQLQIARDSALVILNSIDEHDKVSERESVLVYRAPSMLQCFGKLKKKSHMFLVKSAVTPSNCFVFCFVVLFLQISILSVAETVRSCSLDQCYKSLLSPATSETKRKMSTFISNIKASDGATQHAVGFQKAFQLLRNTSSLSKQSTSKKIVLTLKVRNIRCCPSIFLSDQFQLLCAGFRFFS